MNRRVIVWGSAVVTVLATAVGCASSGNAHESPPLRGTLLSTSASPTDLASLAASNKKQADAEARRLLSLAHIPPGATELSAAPSSEPMPALGSSRTSSLIDHATFYRVQMPFDAAVAWVKAHPPSGLDGAGGSMSGTDAGGVSVAGFSFSEPATDAWRGGQFEIEVASDGADASDIRVDGVTEWLDPTPWRDTSSGNRLTVTVAAGCPQSDKGYGGVANQGAEFDNALLPPGKPTDGLICVYDGMNGKAFNLVGQHRLGADDAAKLASVVRAMPLAHLDDVVTSCPMDDEAAAVIVLSFPNRPDAALWSKSNGCRAVTNGHIEGQPDDAFDAIMTPLTKASQPLP